MSLIDMGWVVSDGGISYHWARCTHCGEVTAVQHPRLSRQKSCGCLPPPSRVHGLSNTGAYKTWLSMRRRCGSASGKAGKWYSDKGVEVCEEWNKFENFYRDMGDRPDGHTLDRIDNSKGYFKDNCRWASKREQNINRDVTLYIDITEGERILLIDFVEQTGVKYSTAYRWLSMRQIEKLHKKWRERR